MGEIIDKIKLVRARRRLENNIRRGEATLGEMIRLGVNEGAVVQHIRSPRMLGFVNMEIEAEEEGDPILARQKKAIVAEQRSRLSPAELAAVIAIDVQRARKTLEQVNSDKSQH